MKKEFTASVYLIENQKVLLIYHRKLEKWLPPGGHLEENETPDEAARREVKEETGLEFEYINQNGLEINCWNAKSIQHPYLCLLEEIPAYRELPAHQHVDFVFVGKPIGGECHNSFSSRWFEWEDLKKLQPDVEIFLETLQVIQHLLQKFSQPTQPAFSTMMQVNPVG